MLGMTKMGQAAIETRGNDDCHVILRGGRPTTPKPMSMLEAAHENAQRHQLCHGRRRSMFRNEA
jgi:phospho-2-dehydro-3-deoxyheptonate aldolase